MRRKENEPIEHKKYIVLFLIAGILFFGFLAVSSILTKKRYEAADGVVAAVGWERRTDSDSAENYLLVNYQAEGERYQAKVPVILHLGAHAGQKKTVYYNPEIPTEVWNGQQLFLSSIMLLFFLLALVVMVFSKKK